MPLDAQTPYGVGIAGLAFSVGTVVTTQVVNGAKPFTGYQYTEAGGKHLDQALDILNGPDAQNIDGIVLTNYLNESEVLVPQSQKLYQCTESIMGSIMYTSEAKSFYTRAEKLHRRTKASSQQGGIEKTRKDLEKRQEIKQREQLGRRPLPAVPIHANIHSQASHSQAPEYPPTGAYCV